MRCNLISSWERMVAKLCNGFQEEENDMQVVDLRHIKQKTGEGTKKVLWSKNKREKSWKKIIEETILKSPVRMMLDQEGDKEKGVG